LRQAVTLWEETESPFKQDYGGIPAKAGFVNQAAKQGGNPTAQTADGAKRDGVARDNLAGDRVARDAAASETAAREGALIDRILGGERELFHDLIRPYERGLYLAAYSVLLNEADAEDVAQDAAIKAYQGLRNFRREARFSTWLTAIALNEARSRWRKAHGEPVESLSDGVEDNGGDYTPSVLADWRYIPSQALERKELRQALREAMAKLPRDQREVLIQRDVRGMNVAETAVITGVSEGLVRVRLFRARLSMQKLLAPQLGPKQGGFMGWLTRKAGGR
jgi:RNA polymerase sigma-70 factor, ECF subfamily